MNWSTLFSWLLLIAVGGSIGYSVIALLGALRFSRARGKAAGGDISSSPLPPLSVLKPLYGSDRELAANLESFFRQNYPAYELLFSVREEADEAVPIVRQLEKAYPHIPLRLILTGPPKYWNAKVHSMEAMMEAAAHEILVINDSSIRVEPDYLRRIVRPLADPSVGLVTCVTRAVPSDRLGSRLEALHINTQYLGGILAAWVLLGMEFALGNTLVTRKEQVRRIGGFGRLGSYLADDFVLGEQIAQKGYHVILSDAVPEKFLASPSGWTNLLHWLRWERSSYYSRPAGYFGQIFMHSTPLALLAWAFAPPGSTLAQALIAACLAVRAALAWACAGLLLRDSAFRRDRWLLPFQDLMSFAIWCCAFFGRKIVWRGARFRVRKGGLLEPIQNSPGARSNPNTVSEK